MSASKILAYLNSRHRAQEEVLQNNTYSYVASNQQQHYLFIAELIKIGQSRGGDYVLVTAYEPRITMDIYSEFTTTIPKQIVSEVAAGFGISKNLLAKLSNNLRRFSYMVDDIGHEMHFKLRLERYVKSHNKVLTFVDVSDEDEYTRVIETNLTTSEISKLAKSSQIFKKIHRSIKRIN